jgi:hypothetical protein
VCENGTSLSIEVRNLGQAAVPPGAEVELYKGDPPNGTSILLAATTLTLYPAQAQTFVVPVTDAEVKAGTVNVYAVVTAPSGVFECRLDNNQSAPGLGTCSKL